MNRHIAQIFQSTLVKWLLLVLVIGALAGSASAFFLISLDWLTNYREANSRIIFLLPFAGLIIGLVYHYYGKDIAKGNNLLLEEYEQAPYALSCA